MARTLRGTKCGYDNIAVGSASGQERTISGAAPPAELTGKWIDDLSVGNPPPTTVRQDNYVVGTATPTGENVKVGG